MKDDDWSLVLRVNLEAAFRLSRAALKGAILARLDNLGKGASGAAVQNIRLMLELA